VTLRHRLLVGGSNCLVKEGYGARLQAALPGRWRSESLGGSPSLRGVDYLLQRPELVERMDSIVFEYTLNDLIFEVAGTLEPLTHLEGLRTLAARPEVAERLSFVMLCGSRASTPALRRHAFAANHYLRVAAEFGVRCIDLREDIEGLIATHGRDGTFSDPDHFSAAAAQTLAERTARALADPAPRPAAQPRADAPAPLALRSLDPLVDGEGEGVTRLPFKTSLLEVSLASLQADSVLRLRSPGGLLVGFYAMHASDAGAVRLTLGRHDVVKPLRFRGAPDRRFVTLRNLVAPLPTAPGDELVVRHVPDAYAVPGAIVDAGRAPILAAGGPTVAVGRFLFLSPAT
jgi:hypothetical protein